MAKTQQVGTDNTQKQMVRLNNIRYFDCPLQGISSYFYIYVA